MKITGVGPKGEGKYTQKDNVNELGQKRNANLNVGLKINIVFFYGNILSEGETFYILGSSTAFLTRIHTRQDAEDAGRARGMESSRRRTNVGIKEDEEE